MYVQSSKIHRCKEQTLRLMTRGEIHTFYFSGPRYFSSYDGKRPEKIESQTHFFKTKQKRTEMRKNEKKKEKSEHVRRLLRNQL